MTERPDGRGPYSLGQIVWVHDVNQRRLGGPRKGVVTKVGRTLVTVGDAEHPTWPTKTFRMEDGRANNNYGHQWIKTEEQQEADERLAAAGQRLRDQGVRFDIGSRRFPVEVMEAMADLIEASEKGSTPSRQALACPLCGGRLAITERTGTDWVVIVRTGRAIECTGCLAQWDDAGEPTLPPYPVRKGSS